MGEFKEKLVPITTPTPSEGRTRKQFECPLCVDAFKHFSQLKWHLLSMHPRRQMIMELVMERYGKRHTEVSTIPTLDSQRAQELSTSFKQTAENLEPIGVGMEATSKTFKVPLKSQPPSAAVPKIRSNLFKSRCKEFDRLPKVNPAEDRSSWESYLSFCLSNGESSEPVHGDN